MVQAIYEWDGPTSERDVRQLYALSLARAPESAETLASMMRQELVHLVPMFFGSAEFSATVVAPLRDGQRLSGGLFDTSPGLDLVQWVVENITIGVEGAAEVLAAAQSWHALYLALFRDEAFRRVCPAPTMDGVALAALEQFSTVEGGITSCRPGEVSGWAIAPSSPDRVLSLRAVVEGETVCVAAVNAFRRDIQDRFGGEGRSGFRMRLPAFIDRIMREGRLEIFEAESGIFIGAVALEQPVPPQGAYRALKQELAQMRAAIEVIENTLPALDAEQAYDLSAYDDHSLGSLGASALLGDGAAADGVDKIGLLVVLDCRTVSPSRLDDAVDSVMAQTWSGWSLVLIGEGEGVEDLANRTRWRRPDRAVTVVSAAMSVAQVISEAEAAAPEFASLGLVVLDGSAVLASSAFSIVVETLRGPNAPDVTYWDEDHLSRRVYDEAKSWRIRPRVDPILKSGFDFDLFLQEPLIGKSAAFLAASLPVDLDLGRLLDVDAFALDRAGEGASMAHLPWILSSRQDKESVNLDDWRMTVQSLLDQAGGRATAIVEPDVLGAPSAIRVSRREGLDVVSAAVIVPTRDRLDLLQPCIDSILHSAASNRVRPEIIVIDHESSDPATLAYLARLSAEGAIRIISHAGDFNWALMNNLAAAQTSADVLIFLNNDTAVITPDWLDELCGEAIRPEVGVVGARLIYADGAIQHAGFVARDRPEYFMGPEGVGDAGADGGYMGRHARLHQAAAVTGACMAIRRGVFESLGGFDAARLPVDWNDIDLCLRAKAAGLRVLYDPHATLYHFESRSRGFTRDGEKQERSNQAQALVWERWGEGFKSDPFYNPRFDRQSVPFTRLKAVYAAWPALTERSNVESMLDEQETVNVNTCVEGGDSLNAARPAGLFRRIKAFVTALDGRAGLRRSAF